MDSASRGGRLIGYKRLAPVQRVLISLVSLLILMYGIYHLTHKGEVSGRTELAGFGLLMLALLLPHRARRSYHRLSELQVVCLGLVDGFVLGFGIYHLTTPDGLRSGIMELSSFALLTAAILYPFREPGDERGAESGERG